MKIKTKLLLGVGLLFLMIALLTILSSVFINRLSNDSKNILTDNYNTIDYSRQMLNALDKNLVNKETRNDFYANLEKQQSTITELGEEDLTNELSATFEKLRLEPGDTALQKNVRRVIHDIMLLNMQAIQRKSSVAQNTAESSIFWVSLTGTICLLLALTMLVNLPSNIANPIKQLTASIKQIASKNYDQRVHFEKSNEFGELAAAFNTMAQKLQEYSSTSLAKLMMEKKRTETLINNMSEPVIGLDDRQRILFINEIALKIAGITNESLVGKSIEEVAKYNDLIKALTDGLAEGKIEKPAVKLPPIKIYANNKESYFEKESIPIFITPTGENEETYIGTVIILQNITPYKELEFAKTNFIANISHELKTPIASIKMSLQLLSNKKVGGLNNEQESLLESINEDAARLLKITGELLRVTQVESGMIDITMRPVDAKDIVDYALEANRNLAREKQVVLKTALGENLPEILADPEKTSWVLTNLISNAIRYSYEHATVFIEVKRHMEKIIFSVIDTGQGISQQYVSKIFDRYFKVPGSKKEGTGLGLSISKEFIEAQGGTIEVKSELGAGSTFIFELNVAS